MSSKSQITDLFSEKINESVTTVETQNESPHEDNIPGNQNGLRVNRLFTKKGSDPLEETLYERRSSRITEPNGEVVFESFIGLSLTFNHQAMDGAPAARFLQSLSRNIKDIDLLIAL